jgi:hypothetical protein
MAGLVWVTVGGVAVVAGVLWALLRGPSGSDDLGTISSQWMAERRSHEREPAIATDPPEAFAGWSAVALDVDDVNTSAYPRACRHGHAR